jgi:cyclic pyranopterin phosphate synthase
MIEIYTDGACLGNPGPGGWAAIVVKSGVTATYSGRERQTTNNRMEIMAAVKGLQATPESAEATVFSDSEYVVKTMTRGWKRNKNLDLWAMLDAEARKRRVKWEWVQGHAGHPMNEMADRLAVQEAQMASGRPSKEAEVVGVQGSGYHYPVPPGAPSLSHVDESGKARMVDVGGKPDTERVAVARGSVVMKPETLALIKANGVEKGDVVGVARIAGIMGAKRTSELIPLCHPIPLNNVSVDFEMDDARNAVNITATAKTTAKTGVEMEAMTAVSIAALTIYDMCKAVDHAIRIEGVRLVRKSGGVSGDIVLEE